MDVFWPLNHSPICSSLKCREKDSAGEKTLDFPARLFRITYKKMKFKEKRLHHHTNSYTVLFFYSSLLDIIAASTYVASISSINTFVDQGFMPNRVNQCSEP